MTPETNMETTSKNELMQLMYPISKRMQRRLETMLRVRDTPFVIHFWNAFPVDGPEIFNLCVRKNIPYQIEDIRFDSTEEAVVYICATQIERDDLTLPFRRYLLGRLYNAEWILSRQEKICAGENTFIPQCVFHRYTPRKVDIYAKPFHGDWTAFRMACAYNLSEPTIKTYKRFALSIDSIREKDEDLAALILAGLCRPSRKETLRLSELPKSEVEEYRNQWMKTYRPQTSIAKRSKPEEKPAEKSIKDMPDYEPDAEASALIYTIPSWCGSMDRFLKKADLSAISEEASSNLLKAIEDLQLKALEVQIGMEE